MLMMPHISDDEYETMDRLRDFCADPKNFHIDLKPAEKKPFHIGTIDGEVTLIKTELTMYGWGGCGNNIGTQVHIRLAFRSDGRSFDEELALGPAPYVQQKGPLRLAANENAQGGATVHLGL